MTYEDPVGGVTMPEGGRTIERIESGSGTLTAKPNGWVDGPP
jgi:hypothetical protein